MRDIVHREDDYEEEEEDMSEYPTLRHINLPPGATFGCHDYTERFFRCLPTQGYLDNWSDPQLDQKVYLRLFFDTEPFQRVLDGVITDVVSPHLIIASVKSIPDTWPSSQAPNTTSQQNASTEDLESEDSDDDFYDNRGVETLDDYHQQSNKIAQDHNEHHVDSVFEDESEWTAVLFKENNRLNKWVLHSLFRYPTSNSSTINEAVDAAPSLPFDIEALRSEVETRWQRKSEEARQLSQQVYQLNVQLNGINPPIWRRFLVLGNTSLYKLHQILNEVMGWSTDEQEFHFEIGGDVFDEDSTQNHLGDDRPSGSQDASTYTLANLNLLEGESFTYEYDLTDCWRHTVTIEKVFPLRSSTEAADYPRCIGGARACPPEDCGGAAGYAEFLDKVCRRQDQGRQQEDADAAADRSDRIEWARMQIGRTNTNVALDEDRHTMPPVVESVYVQHPDDGSTMEVRTLLPAPGPNTYNPEAFNLDLVNAVLQATITK